MDGRKILVGILLVALFIPMLQREFMFADERKLHGWFPPVKEPRFLLANWFSGSLQDSLLVHANSTMGFRNSLFRIHNQFYYSLFKIAKANGVIIGKENVLYDRSHIDAYTGKDYIGEDASQARFRMLKDLQRIWKQKGIKFHLVMVPGKATALPEQLPAGTNAPVAMTNYRRHMQLADSLDIACLDLVGWFKQRQKIEMYPLYPAGGIHWSNYCATLAADTLAGYIAKQTGQPLNRLHVDSVRLSDHEEGEDADVALGMNLLFPLASRPAAYPHVHFDNGPRKLKVLTIGDSFFFHSFTNHSFPVYEAPHFFFYFNELYILGNDQFVRREELDLLKEMDSQDVIQLYCSDANLAKLGWGFIEEAWKTYFDPARRAPRLEGIKENIRKDANWMQVIAEKANKAGLPVDTMLERDAVWVWENNRF